MFLFFPKTKRLLGKGQLFFGAPGNFSCPIVVGEGNVHLSPSAATVKAASQVSKIRQVPQEPPRLAKRKQETSTQLSLYIYLHLRCLQLGKSYNPTESSFLS